LGVRTTIVLDEDLDRKIRKRAAETGARLSKVIGDLLRAGLLSQRARRSGTYRLDWPTTRGTLLPGVDVDDRDRLCDAMEGRTGGEGR
jgi:plasmid stability protein